MWKQLVFLGGLALSVGLAHAQGSISATYGTSVTLDIQNDLAQIITFEGKAGDIVYVSQFSQTVDIPLTLYSPDGTVLSQSFDFQQQVIIPTTLTGDGTYTLSVQRPDYDDTTGSTQILIDTTTLSDIADTPVTGTFKQPGEMRWFAHQATKGGLYRMAATCDNCSFFEILPSQDVVGTTYTGLNPSLLLDQWKEDGRVLIGSLTTTAGDYSFSLIPVTPIPVTQNTPLEGRVLNNGSEVFSFTSAEGKAWRLDSTLSNQGDRIMGLFMFEGRANSDSLITFDTGSGPDGNPQITPFIAPADATYYVVLIWRGYRAEEVDSPYTLTLRPESLRQITPDGASFDGHVTGVAGAERYLYRGKAGETLTLTLLKTGGEGQPSIRMVGPDDEALVFQGRAVTRLVVDLQLPTDGLYQIAVTNIGYDNTSVLDYSLSLQTLTAP